MQLEALQALKELEFFWFQLFFCSPNDATIFV